MLENFLFVWRLFFVSITCFACVLSCFRLMRFYDKNLCYTRAGFCSPIDRVRSAPPSSSSSRLFDLLIIKRIRATKMGKFCLGAFDRLHKCFARVQTKEQNKTKKTHIDRRSRKRARQKAALLSIRGEYTDKRSPSRSDYLRIQSSRGKLQSQYRRLLSCIAS